jgi:hypothetical protein
MEGQDEPTQGWFGRPMGSTDPFVGPPRHVLSRGGCPVGPKVGPRCPPGFEVVCLPVGPSIHVTSTCHPLIRRGRFPWIDDMACMHGIQGGSPFLAR